MPVQHKTIETSITCAQVTSCPEGSYLVCHRDYTIEHGTQTPFLDSYGIGCLPITVPQHLSGFGIILSKHPLPAAVLPPPAHTLWWNRIPTQHRLCCSFHPSRCHLKGTDLAFPSNQHILWKRPPSQTQLCRVIWPLNAFRKGTRGIQAGLWRRRCRFPGGGEGQSCCPSCWHCAEALGGETRGAGLVQPG